jgi:hypothetical protein
MTLSELLRGLGQERFEALLREVSMGALRTYRLFESFKVRARLLKLNREKLRNAAPKLWERLGEGDEDLARELSQGVLVSNLDFVAEALDHLGIQHDGNGFFDKEAQADDKLKEGWRENLLAAFRERYPEPLILLYINHLDWELGKPETVFVG